MTFKKSWMSSSTWLMRMVTGIEAILQKNLFSKGPPFERTVLRWMDQEVTETRRWRRIDKGNLLKRHPSLMVSTTSRFYPQDMIKKIKQKSQRSSCLSESNWNRKTGASFLLLDFLQHLFWENQTASVNFPNHQWTGIRYRKEISIRNIDYV